MGWWKKRSSTEIKTLTGARHCLEADRLIFPGGVQVNVSLIGDLPARLERHDFERHGVLRMLESEIPGIRRCLYYWFEPQSHGELIGEMLSSWPGGSRYADQESKEDS